ncbi:MAG TPA: glycosyltransferase [Syntrophales bacterium]|nr:glycosyltransferase [Syntrophales bacterium]HQN77888.1 glycosyltransferase [Syntrophales bacterium]HQQ27572.1 glycosyltransferase [Syntrophales bacterium]
MRIVVDLQGAQTINRFKGIGRRSLALTLAMARKAIKHDLWVVLNGAFTESILNLRVTFEGIIPQECIRVFEVPSSVAECHPENTWRTRAAEKIREQFIQQLQPDVILLTSLFEGYDDNAVTSIGAFVPGTGTAVMLHDPIPFLGGTRPISETRWKQFFERKMQSLKNAGMLFPTSWDQGDKVIDALEYPRDRVVSLPVAPDPLFKAGTVLPEEAAALCRRLAITRKMVLYALDGSGDRENLDRLFNAFTFLPQRLRKDYQFVFTGIKDNAAFAEVKRLCKSKKIAEDAFVWSESLSEEDLLALCRLAELCVFPAGRSSTGLTVLDAMACGAPVMGPDASKLPGVRSPVAFDPSSPQSIAGEIKKVLTSEKLRRKLREEGLRQAAAFCWDETAGIVISAFEDFHSRVKREKIPAEYPRKRPRLAYVSPFPPERSGISDYSAALLPELARHYEIEAIAAQETVLDPWIIANCPVHDVEWFRQHASEYGRIIYHFGNSPFHSHMFGLLRRHPGVVVLHDFFLSHVLAYEEMSSSMPGVWREALYRSHGYSALQKSYLDRDTADVVMRFPCNLAVLQDALGIIVHCEYSQKLAAHWYNGDAAADWAMIPMLRVPVHNMDRMDARRRLRLREDDFVVCSFGMLGPTKLNHRLLKVWLASDLAEKDRCILIFVGENPESDYGKRLVQEIRRSGMEQRICITGWADADTFRCYLSAADVGVQLRTHSRGETSAAILDCMNHGLPTIINANGSASELPDQAIWKLPDDFTDSELVEALETLFRDAGRRGKLAFHAREAIRTRHKPSLCADQYAEAIESMYLRAAYGRNGLVKAVASQGRPLPSHRDVALVAKSMAASLIPTPSQRQLLVDVSAIARNDLKTGIERSVRAQLMKLIQQPPPGFRVEPVFLTDQGGQWHYRYARKYSCGLLGIGQGNLSDEPIDVSRGDVFYGADFFPGGVIEAAKAGLYLKWVASGLSIHFMVYDLLPVLRPEFFPEGAARTHTAWLKAVSESSSQLICISNTVADELRLWLEKNPPERRLALRIDAVHLGADFSASKSSGGLPASAKKVLAKIREIPSFLMVGTIEPRKGHLQTLEAFDRLWDENRRVNLVIAGAEGWKHLPDSQRRTIPKIVARIMKHKESGKHLFWLEGISDEYLEKIYEACACLIAASEGEGFGLPLIEAARHGLPIIARDIPVFREVAREHACYFTGADAGNLASAIGNWCSLRAKGKVPSSSTLQWCTWEENARTLTAVLLGRRNRST